jgi:hypothetical protein
VTQTAYGWNADHQPPRGLRAARLHGRSQLCDVAYLHQYLNRGLVADCAARGITCFDLAADVTFVADDYYDPLHNTPVGAAKVGRYLARRIAGLDASLLAPRH